MLPAVVTVAAPNARGASVAGSVARAATVLTVAPAAIATLRAAFALLFFSSLILLSSGLGFANTISGVYISFIPTLAIIVIFPYVFLSIHLLKIMVNENTGQPINIKLHRKIFLILILFYKIILFGIIQNMEILLISIYILFFGTHSSIQKVAIKKSSETSVLVLYTTVAAILMLIHIPFGIAVSWEYVCLFAFKGLILAISWFVTLKVLQKVDLSIVTTTNILSAALSFIMAVVIFKEAATATKIIGSIIVVGGIALLNLSTKKEKGSVNAWQLILLIFTAIVSATCSVIDKFTTTYLTPHQVQFWFVIFTAFFSWVIFGIECGKKKEFLIKKHDLKNGWIYLLGITLVIADFLLFSAYRVPGSQMITISMLSKMRSIVPVFAGIIFFKEKNIVRKIIYAIIVILGAVLISL